MCCVEADQRQEHDDNDEADQENDDNDEAGQENDDNDEAGHENDDNEVDQPPVEVQEEIVVGCGDGTGEHG